MPRSSNRIARRNQDISLRFKYHRKKNPKWVIDFVIEAVAEEFYLSPVTITKILKQRQESVPDHSTISRRIA